jgi:hypothetical protein
MIFTTLLLIFENQEREFQSQNQIILCNQLNEKNSQILDELNEHSIFEQSISEHKTAVPDHVFTFDYNQCINKYNKVRFKSS